MAKSHPKAAPRRDSAEPVESNAPDSEYAALVKEEILWLPRTLIDPDPDQVRTIFEGLDELRAQIESEGLLEILTVRPNPNTADRFMLVNGERRWRATDGMARVRPDAPDGCLPCRITFEVEDPADRLIAQFLQNKGEPLTPIEEGKLFKRLIEQHGLSDAQLAKRLGVARSTLGDRRRIAELPETWGSLLESGGITVSQAVEITKYSRLPAPVHNAVVKETTGQWWRKPSTPVSQFGDQLAQAYREHLYPLGKNGLHYGDVAIAADAVKRHDVECTCGRISRKGYDKQLVEYCGNSDWWKPLVKAARDHLEEVHAKAEVRNAAKRKTALQMPAGTPVIQWEGSNKVPAGYVLLTKDNRWATDFQNAKAFDPDDFVIDDAQLVRWNAPKDWQGKSSEGVMTVDTVAVKHARDAWNARWDARSAEIESAVKAQLNEALSSSKYRLPDSASEVARQLLLTVFSVHLNAYSTDQVFGELRQAADIIGEELPENLTTAFNKRSGDRREQLRAWLANEQGSPLVSIVMAFSAVQGEKITPAATLLQLEKETALREIASRQTPWGDAPGPVIQTPCDVCEGELEGATQEEIDMGVHRACDPDSFIDSAEEDDEEDAAPKKKKGRALAAMGHDGGDDDDELMARDTSLDDELEEVGADA
ncbi:MAG: nucleoid occlusion protein [Gemmatimonadetes bacterium]|nr:nucleoid occlusion protein [Gemmatimonadota bacterium]